MHRIDSPGAVEDLFGAGLDGFTEADPINGVAPTEVGANWLNAVQEEIANAIVALGGTLLLSTNDTRNQLGGLLGGLGRLAANNVWTGLNAFRNAAGLLIDSAAGEVRYGDGAGAAATRTRVLRFGASDAVILYPVTYPGRAVNDSELYRSIDFDRAASGPVVVWDLTKLLPGGVTITQLRVLVQPGAARTVQTSSPGDNGRMFFGLYAFAHDWTTPAEATPFSPSYAEDNGIAALQVMTSGAITYALARNTTSVHCRVFGGDDATTNRDRVYGLEVTLDDPGYSGVR